MDGMPVPITVYLIAKAHVLIRKHLYFDGPSTCVDLFMSLGCSSNVISSPKTTSANPEREPIVY